MEYCVYITYNCNMSCTYCLAKKVINTNSNTNISEQQIDQIVNYIEKNNKQEDRVVFFGGEPLLRPDIINKFVCKASKLNVYFLLYTNGLKLEKSLVNTLKNISVIFVSFDGDSNSHKKYRGKGTYDTIIENLKQVKPLLNDTNFIGRITLEEDTDIYQSVTNMLYYVDAVYWQIVNKPEFVYPSKFIETYKKGITKLFEFWLNNLKNGEILNIIPFQAISSYYIFDYRRGQKSFRCGASTEYQVIDINGNIFWCDEYIGSEKDIVDNVNSIVNNERSDINLDYSHHTKIFDDCANCSVSDICLGRCKKCLVEYKKQQVRIYCQATILLIKLVENNIDQIKDALIKNSFSFKEFYKQPHCTEEIP